MKVKAAMDIIYPDKDGKPVVMWKKGEEIKDKAVAENFLTYSPKIIEVEDDKKAAKKSEKPSMAGEKKSKKKR